MFFSPYQSVPIIPSSYSFTSMPVFLHFFHPLSLLLSASVVCLTVNLSSTLSASLQSLSQDFLGWAGSDGVRVLRNSPPIIPHCLARSLCCLQHVHTYVNTRAYMRTHSCSSWKSGESFCVAWQLGRSSISSVRGLKWTRSLRLSLSTYTCTHETRLVREIRLNKGIGECNYMCLYKDLFILVAG